MELRLVSSRFRFLSGDATIWFGDLPPTDASGFAAIALPFQDGVIHVDGPAAGLVKAMISNAIVVREGEETRVSACVVKGDIPEDALARGTIDIGVDPRTIVRVTLGSAANTPGATIGVATEDGTFECVADARGGVDFLLPPGHYVAYAFNAPETRTSFAVDEADPPSRVLILEL